MQGDVPDLAKAVAGGKVLGEPEPQTVQSRVPAVPLKRVGAEGEVPSRSHPTDAGIDLPSNEDLTLEPGERALVSTGWAMALPIGATGLVCPRSGLAVKHGITVLNGPGVIDSGYRGELKVSLINLSDETFEITKGMRIAQVVITAHAMNHPWEVDELPPADRGDNGFGSTGG